MEHSKLEKLRRLDGPILVTGHTGFKGTWLISLLKYLDIDAVGVSLPPIKDSLYERGEFKGLIPEEFGDIRSLSFVKNQIKKFEPAAILHLAAQPLVIQSYVDPIATFEINVMGTANVLKAALEFEKIKGVGVVTTDKVYKNKNLGRRFTEDDALMGDDPYSASKVAAEAVVSAWRKISKVADGPSIVSLRAGNVIGGGDFSEHRLLPDAVRARMGNNELVLRNPLSTRPWQHVLDPLWGYLLALNSIIDGSPQTAFNFGPDEESLSVSQVVAELKKNWKLNTRETVESNSIQEAKLLDLDSTLAMRELNWKPIYSQQEAIIKTQQWWDQNLEFKVSEKEICLSQITEFLEFHLE